MISLSKRHLQRDVLLTYLVSGLALFSLGFIVAPGQFTNGTFSFLVLALCLATGLLVVTGVGRVRYSLRTFDALECRLRRAAQADVTEVCTPLLEASPIAAGWNRLIETLNVRTWDQGIERRLAQVASDRGSERYARALRSLSEGLAITDKHGRINYINPAWKRLVQRQADDESDTLGLCILQTLGSAGFSNWNDWNASLLEGTKPLCIALRYGVHVAEGVLQLSRLPLEGRARENEGYVWTLRDVTQQSLANEAHEQFLAAATHELRTPLTNITAYSESLLDMEHIPVDQQREFFNVIHSEAERLNRLLNELLDIQQLEAGSMTINSATFDVQRMLQEIQEYIAPLVDKKQLKLICRIAPDIKSIQADKEKIISCLVNLLGNAVKYTPEGGEIRLIAEQHDASVVISVEDTGIGIAPEEQSKIFERFYRCHDARVSDIEGNGLGLAFALEVARLHHGDLKVQSTPEVGSRFTLRLPQSSAH